MGSQVGFDVTIVNLYLFIACCLNAVAKSVVSQANDDDLVLQRSLVLEGLAPFV